MGWLGTRKYTDFEIRCSGFNVICRSEIVVPLSNMPIAERADLPDMITLYIFYCIEGDQLN